MSELAETSSDIKVSSNCLTCACLITSLVLNIEQIEIDIVKDIKSDIQIHDQARTLTTTSVHSMRKGELSHRDPTKTRVKQS